MARVEETIEVNVPVATAYNQWTQFEEFPKFMEGVESVKQIDDTHLRWVAEIGGKRHEWEAEITEQKPDQKVAWRAVDGHDNSGIVTFDGAHFHSERRLGLVGDNFNKADVIGRLKGHIALGHNRYSTTVDTILRNVTLALLGLSPLRWNPFRDIDREPNLVSLEHTNETVGVIGVRVSERDEVDAPFPGRKARPQLSKESLRIGTAVDEERSTIELDEERVALADVEGPDAYSVRPRPEDGCASDDESHSKDGARPECSAREESSPKGPHTRDPRPRNSLGERAPKARDQHRAEEECEGDPGAVGESRERAVGNGQRRQRKRRGRLDDESQQKRERVGKKRRHLREIARDRSERGRRGPGEHQGREQRHREEVGERGHERYPPEYRGDDR